VKRISRIVLGEPWEFLVAGRIRRVISGELQHVLHRAGSHYDLEAGDTADGFSSDGEGPLGVLRDFDKDADQDRGEEDHVA